MSNTDTNNMQKYVNYREQMGRLKKALGNEFFLEAIFIEYAILEDRLESVLRHIGKWNPRPDEHVSIDRKCRLVAKLAEEKKGLARRYFSLELTDWILDWKEQRNTLIHALLKQSLSKTELKEFAEKGHDLVKELINKVNLYNRALKRRDLKQIVFSRIWYLICLISI